jgi:hypothetical protein
MKGKANELQDSLYTAGQRDWTKAVAPQGRRSCYESGEVTKSERGGVQWLAALVLNQPMPSSGEHRLLWQGQWVLSMAPGYCLGN